MGIIITGQVGMATVIGLVEQFVKGLIDLYFSRRELGRIDLRHTFMVLCKGF